MIAAGALLNQITDRKYLRRNLIAGLSAIALIAAVVFADNLVRLFERPEGSLAAVQEDDDLNRIWETLAKDGAQKAAHSKMIAVTQNGKRYLYVVGGMEVVFHHVPENRYVQTLSKSVRRIELDDRRGTVTGASWEGEGQAWGQTQFGHAEFGLVQVGNYIYVVGGDINIPKVEENQNQSAMLYSTVERLNLNNPAAGWEIFALLAGVNFYPEVMVDGSDIHVVGGVYGNPFPPLNEDVKETYIQDMLNPAEDFAMWPNIKNKPVIGGTGIFLNHTQQNGTIVGNNVATQGSSQGGTTDGGIDQGPATGPGQSLNEGGSAVEGVTIQALDEERLKIVSPNGPGTLYRGYETTVVVTTKGAGQFGDGGSISIRENPTAQWQLIRQVRIYPNSTREYKIEIPATVPLTTTAQIRVCNTTTSCDDPGFNNVYDISDGNLTVADAGLVITSPTATSKWYKPGTYPINWETNLPGGSLVSVWWQQEGSTTWNLYHPSLDNDGSVDFPVPAEAEVGRMRVRLCVGWDETQFPQFVPDCSTATAVSPFFALSGHSVTITKPVLNDQFPGDSTTSIQWTADTNYTKASLWWKKHYGDGSSAGWKLITDQATTGPTGGQINWRVPNELTSDAVVAVCLGGGTDHNYCAVYGGPAGKYDVSDTFKIGDGVNVHVKTPNGGEFLHANTTQNPSIKTIEWDSNATEEGCRVYFSASGGDAGSWTTIGSVPAGARSFDWTVPNTPTSRGRIKVSCQQVPEKADISDADFFIIAGPISSTKLTEALISGQFVTTVGEHFVIKTNAVGTSTFDELKSDFIGKLSTQWIPGTVAKLGHLRFMITQGGAVVPVPQGRYGHKLTKGLNGGLFGVIGGATWTKEVTVGSEAFKTFWAIDDATHPVYRTGSDFTFNFGRTEQIPTYKYEFVGNISYAYMPSRPVASRWIGTNGPAALGNYTGLKLDDRFALKDTSGSSKKGRAFMGYAPIPGSELAVGGLENTSTTGGGYEVYQGNFSQGNKKFFRIPVASTARAERLKSQWEKEESYTWLNTEVDPGDLDIYKPAYNLQAFALQNKAVVYGGQTDFQEALSQTTDHDPHVPDYQYTFGPKTFMYKPTDIVTDARWFSMANLGIEGSGGEFKYVRIKPGISTLSAGSEIKFTATAHNANGVVIPNAACTWSIENGFGLGTVDSTTGLFQAVGSIDLYRRSARAIKAVCVADSVTKIGYADIGVYPAGNPAPAPLLSYIEVNPESAVTLPGTPRNLEARAYDQYYQSLSEDITYDWRVNDPGLGSPTVGNQSRFAFTATKDPGFIGDHNNAISLTVSAPDAGGGRRSFVRDVDIVIPANPYADGSSAQSFAANYMVATGSGNPILAIYHFGGIDSNTLQTLGLFGRGNITGTLTVATSPITPDGFFGSDVIITLKDGLDEPVMQNSLGERYAARLGTSRSGDGLVTTDQTFNTGKMERVERLGEIVGSTGHDKELVYFDANGQARFRIYSNTPTPGIDVSGFVEIPNRMSLMVPGLTGRLVVQDIPGVPNPQQSTITADKTKVAADNTDKATVTVTLRDYQGNPVSGYHVKISSSRGAIDTIATLSGVTNASGQATFTVRSATKGLSNIRGYFGKDAAELSTRPTPIVQTLSLEFAASISSLIPNQLRQGETLPEVIATGNQTTWETGKTTINLISPNKSGLAITNPNSHIKANGVSKTLMTVHAPAHPTTPIRLTLTGSGSFYPSGTTSITTNQQGIGTFTYQSGNTPGIVKIKAQVGTTGPSDEVWFMLEDSRDHPYELSIFASPATSLAPGESAKVRGAIYEYVGDQKTLVTDQVEFSYVSDKGSFNPTSHTSQNGVSESTFTRGQTAGPAQVLVTATYASVSLGARLVISQTDDSNDLALESFAVDSTTKITGTNLAATATATVGTWIFRAITDKGAEVEPEVVDYPVIVVSNSTPGGPRLTQVSPSLGYRNTNSLAVVIRGENAFFQGGAQGSQISFTSVNGSSSGITIVGTPTVISPDEINLNIKIENTATMGYWNVKVTTGSRVAELPGDFDFLVTTPSDIVVDVIPSPNVLPRDGKASSNVTIFVGRLDRVTGQITPLPNVDVTVGFAGDGDGGQLNPATGLKTGSVAPNVGIAKTTYKTDTGEEDEEVLIQATVTIDGIPVSNTGLIIKRVFTGYSFVVTANPASLPANGGTSTLTAEIKDREGLPVANGTPVEFFVIGVGSATPSRVTVNGGEGKATTPYTVGPQDQPQLPQIYAKATIEGVGRIISDPIIIPIGVDVSKYRLSVVADRTSIEAGSNQKSTITATLTYVGSGVPVPVSNWPLIFSLSFQQPGDYLTTLSGVTNASGQITTQFNAGYVPGNVVVTAKPIALTAGNAIITKTVGQTVSRELSTISAVPKYVPADDSAFSVITVTVRNAHYVGIPNKTVNLTASRGTIFPASTASTNALGQATFYIKSNTVGTSDLTATVDGIGLATQVFFEAAGSLVGVILDTIVPLEAKSYDRLVKLYLRQPVSGAQPVIDEAYFTNASDAVLDLPTIYLKPNTAYTYWAKGRYHLARTKPVQANGAGTVTVNFAATHKGTANKGLLIADIAPDIDSSSLPTFWHDNAVNAIDVTKIVTAWFRNSYEADFDSNGIVLSTDFTLWTVNYGSGEPLP